MVPNINVQTDYFWLIMSVCTLIASKQSIPPFTYTELLLLLVIFIQNYHILMQIGMNAQNATRAMLHLPETSQNSPDCTK